LHPIGVKKYDGAFLGPVASGAPLFDLRVGVSGAELATVEQLGKIGPDDGLKLAYALARLFDEQVVVKRAWQAESDFRAAMLILLCLCIRVSVLVDVE
jgi:hypothetical protein